MILVVGVKILDRVQGKGCSACAKGVDNFLHAAKSGFCSLVSLAYCSAAFASSLRLRRAWQGTRARRSLCSCIFDGYQSFEF